MVTSYWGGGWGINSNLDETERLLEHCLDSAELGVVELGEARHAQLLWELHL